MERKISNSSNWIRFNSKNICFFFRSFASDWRRSQFAINLRDCSRIVQFKPIEDNNFKYRISHRLCSLCACACAAAGNTKHIIACEPTMRLYVMACHRVYHWQFKYVTVVNCRSVWMYRYSLFEINAYRETIYFQILNSNRNSISNSLFSRE